jgi:hypothetical protein
MNITYIPVDQCFIIYHRGAYSDRFMHYMTPKQVNSVGQRSIFRYKLAIIAYK